VIRKPHVKFGSFSKKLTSFVRLFQCSMTPSLALLPLCIHCALLTETNRRLPLTRQTAGNSKDSG
jgi:hypothetical protein